MRRNSILESLKQLQIKIAQQIPGQKILKVRTSLTAASRNYWRYLGKKVSRIDWPGLHRHGMALISRLRREFFYIDHKALAPYLGLLVLTGFVFIGNQANQQALAATVEQEILVSDVEPDVVESILSALDPLTPEIEEAPEEVASRLVVAGDNGAVLPRPEMTAISEAETLSKKDPIPYTVQKGDTMSSIAKANGRTIATILEANSIAPEDAGKIAPGTVLKIPQEDTSDSLAWLEADQKVKAEAAKKRAEQQAKLATSKKKGGKTLASVRERSSESYAGNSGGNFIVHINHNGISRGIGRGHTGIDYRANVGTAVAAAADGRVIEITHGWAGGWGNSILVDHGGGWTTRYAHLSDNVVGVGNSVGQCQLIGYSGNTGRSTGPHLHFESRINGRAVQPF